MCIRAGLAASVMMYGPRSSAHNTGGERGTGEMRGMGGLSGAMSLTLAAPAHPRVAVLLSAAWWGALFPAIDIQILRPGVYQTGLARLCVGVGPGT